MRRRGLELVVGACLVIGAFGCSAGDEAARGSDEGALRLHFPEQAALVTEAGHGFAEISGGFVPGAVRMGAHPGALGAVLPRRIGEETIRLDLPEGPALQLREAGLHGEGVRAGAAVRYPRDGGASFWVATGAGVEEWLLVEPGVASPGRPIASWEVDGAWPRQEGEFIVWDDASGAPRLIMSAPAAFASSGRPVRVALRAQGRAVELFADAGDAGEALLIDPVWVPAQSMNYPREGHTATLLQDGSVLVTGGFIGEYEYQRTAQNSAERFYPASGIWQLTAAMKVARAEHTATLLRNGDVLVLGGATAEIYHPGTQTWSDAASPPESVAGATVTLLEDDTVFVTGGTVGGSPVATTARYDPGSNTWTPQASMDLARSGHAAVRLLDGRVLVVGESSAEVYDPSKDTWSQAGGLLASFHDKHTATLLPDGNVLLVGGTQVSEGAGKPRDVAVEIYVPGTDEWTSNMSLFRGLADHTATLLPDGNVLLAGGYHIQLTQEMPSQERTWKLYDPTRNTITLIDDSVIADRANHAATLLLDQRVLVTGGCRPSRRQGAVATTAMFGVALGAACASGSDCTTGYCVDGVCCDAACSGGPCDACSMRAGASQDGHCEALSGPACDDGQACTRADVCQAGVCVGAPVVCVAPDACQEAACEAETGECVTAPRPDGVACDDGDGCTEGDTCEVGACVPGAPVECPPPPECHARGECNAATGRCDNLPLPDGEGCEDGDACTRGDVCRGGVCEGGDLDSCPEIDCRYAGSCNSTTGACEREKKPDGTRCGGGTCVGGECRSGPGGPGGPGDGAGGSSGSVGGGGPDSSSGGGCRCVVGAPRSAPAPWAALLLLLSMARRARPRPGCRR
ncbi:kelch repeat-containing protein [Sorangium sp. So ce204]|uniref:Kelch repeat-containing protein n=1 Tax=Sorangium sp. So ce204 TaxID=3133288 RepID=UPI003F62356C